ncbi:MAG: hypothetical protein LBG43_07615, partial [Treponema sp.]|nr:hypothetical protein [Treponema sp.]
MEQEQKELINLIKANTKIIQIISYETLLIHAYLIEVATELGRELYLWNRVEGIKKWDADAEKGRWTLIDGDARQPEKPFEFFSENKNKDKDIIMLLEDFHPDMSENQPQNIKRLRNVAMGGNDQNRTLALSQPFRFLPRELEKEVHIMELPWTSYEDLEVIFKNVCEAYKIPVPDEPDHDLIEAALGLTTMEAEKAFSLAYIESGKLTGAEVPLVIREKENVIKKSGYL